MSDVHIFDAYGTLFDVHSAVHRHSDRFEGNANIVSALWRTKQLEYSWVYGLMGASNDFWTLTQDALTFALSAHNIDDEALKADLLDAYWHLSAYEEVPSFLARLRTHGSKTGILSNGSPDMLEAAIGSANLNDHLDAALSVLSANTFKTDPRSYQLVLDHFGVSTEQVTIYSSNRWDIAGAKKFGFRTIWVNRTGQPDEYRDFAPNQIVSCLMDSQS